MLNLLMTDFFLPLPEMLEADLPGTLSVPVVFYCSESILVTSP